MSGIQQSYKTALVGCLESPVRQYLSSCNQEKNVSSYAESAQKVRSWLQQSFDRDGRCLIDAEDARYYYKTPYLMTMAGLRDRGARVAHQVTDNFVDDAGELVSSAPLENRIYAMGWLALGATITERFDLANILADRLEHYQDRNSGGIVLVDEEAGEEVAEVCFSGGAGMALAAVGRREAARKMANTFKALIVEQGQAGCFYNRFRRDGSVLARKAGGEWEKAYDLQEDEQRPANFATVVNALVWTARVWREQDYLAVARCYVDFVYRHRQNPAQFGRATKFGWAMLNLYAETGEPDLLDKARELGDVLVAKQSADGLWNPQPGNVADAPAWSRLMYSSDCAMTVCALANLDES